jgi:ribonuclease BN (tRNA processing enzyme)
MRLRVLGCSGGIGGRHLRTTSFLVDRDILIDGGTGVGDLSLAELAVIDHVFVTHSHLDHIACIPLLIDTVGDMRNRPVTLYGSEATLTILRNHVFNWSIWPDFTEIPSPEAPFLRYRAVRVGEPIVLAERRITALPANHTVPAVGYRIETAGGSVVFTGDTTSNDELWRLVNRMADLRYLIIETAFSNREKPLALASKHLCPSLLAEELAKLQLRPEVFVTHLKPGQIELTMQELEEDVGDYRPRMLQNGQVFEL